MTTLPQTTNIRLPRPAGSALAAPGAASHYGSNSRGEHDRRRCLARISRNALADRACWLCSAASSASWPICTCQGTTRGTHTASGLGADCRKGASDASPIKVARITCWTCPRSASSNVRRQLISGPMRCSTSVLTRPAVRDTTWFKQFIHDRPRRTMMSPISQP